MERALQETTPASFVELANGEDEAEQIKDEQSDKDAHDVETVECQAQKLEVVSWSP